VTTPASEPEGWDDNVDNEPTRIMSEPEYLAFLDKRMPEIAVEITDGFHAAGIMPEGMRIEWVAVGEAQ
jgi:hypothetical protein